MAVACICDPSPPGKTGELTGSLWRAQEQMQQGRLCLRNKMVEENECPRSCPVMTHVQMHLSTHKTHIKKLFSTVFCS